MLINYITVHLVLFFLVVYLLFLLFLLFLLLLLLLLPLFLPWPWLSCRHSRPPRPPAGPHRIWIWHRQSRRASLLRDGMCKARTQVSIRISAEPLYLGHMSSDHPSISSPILPRPLFARAAQPLTTNTPARSMPSASPSVTTNTNTNTNPSLHPFVPPRWLPLAFFYLAPSPHRTTAHIPIFYSRHLLLFTAHPPSPPPPFSNFPRSDAPSLSSPPITYHLSTVSLSFRDSRTTMRSTMPSVRTASPCLWGVEPSVCCNCSGANCALPVSTQLLLIIPLALPFYSLLYPHCRNISFGVTRSSLISHSLTQLSLILTHSLTLLTAESSFCRPAEHLRSLDCMVYGNRQLRRSCLSPRCELPALILSISISLARLRPCPSFLRHSPEHHPASC